MNGIQTPMVIDLDEGMTLRHPNEFALGEILAVAGVEGEATLAFRVGFRGDDELDALVFLTGPDSFRLFSSNSPDFFPTKALSVTSQFRFGIEDPAPTSLRLAAPGRVVACQLPEPSLSVPVRRLRGEVIAAFAILAGPSRGHLRRPQEGCSCVGRLVVRPISASARPALP